MDLSPTTKEKIMDAAIVLFSDRGYDLVSMRDIALEVGIRAASIYNHFPSKKDILKSAYAFYAEGLCHVLPTIETLLQRLEDEPILDVLKTGLCYYWPPALQDRMDRIILIASQRICLDKDSEDFVREHFFEPLTGLWIPFLNRAAELGKIEPVDVECFTKLITFFAFSAAELNRSTMRITIEQWNSSLDMIFMLLKPRVAP